MNSEDINDILNEEKQFRSLHGRYRWLDQLRGVTVVWLLVAFLTWMFSSILWLGYPPPLGPTWMNHGMRYADYFPSIITVIDMGSSIFMFVLGISAPISFNSKVQKKGLGFAWITLFSRFFLFFWVNIFIKIFYKINFTAILIGFELHDILLLSIWGGITIILVILHFLVLRGTKIQAPVLLFWALLSIGLWYPIIWDSYNVWTIFFGDTLAYLSWGSLLCGLFLTIQKNPDRRIWSAIGLLLVHITLWQIAHYLLISPTHWFFEVFPGTPFDVVGIPFNIISMGAIAISATCVSDWLLNMYLDPKDGMRKRILPFTICMFCFHFIIDFFQPAKHDGVNASLATISIFISIFFLLSFYLWDKYFDVKIPFLTPLGRNALLMFVLQGIYLYIYGYIWSGTYEFRTQFPGTLGNFIAMSIFVGPLAVLFFIAWILDRLRVYVKF